MEKIHRAKLPKLIIELRNYDGADTMLKVEPNPLFMVVDAETGREIDNGYRSYEEAKRAYPEAIN